MSSKLTGGGIDTAIAAVGVAVGAIAAGARATADVGGK